MTYDEVATNETYQHCYEPLVKKCDGEPMTRRICREWPETYCSTKYVPKEPGSKELIADTKCERSQTTICAPVNCAMVPGPQECHEKVTATVIDIPKEVRFQCFCFVSHLLIT